MQNQFSRTQLLMGKAAIDTLMGSRVAVFGVGGVGGYVVEALARSGVGELDIIDDDRVCLTNVNRQVIATLSTVGKHKVDVCEERVHDINRRCIVHKYQMFYLPETADAIDISQFDYVVDCIDTVKANLDLIKPRPESAYHQLHGSSQQNGCHRLSSHRHQQDEDGPTRQGHPQEIAQDEHP